MIAPVSTAVKDTRFKPGNEAARNSGGKRVVAKVRKLFKDADTKKAIKKLLELVDAGDFSAIKLALEYGIGKPTESMEVQMTNIQPQLPYAVTTILARRETMLAEIELDEQLLGLEESA